MKIDKLKWRRRCGWFERLEERRLLAGDTFLINFQFDEATIPSNYLRDTGQVFGDRGDGLDYGWSSDHSDQSRERSIDPDQRLDTLIQIEAGQVWEFALANGLYEVTVAVGDPANNDGQHTINIEGVNYWDAEQDGDTPLFGTRQVAVSDGRLTLDAGAAPNLATRINFVQIVGLPSAPNASPDAPTITEPSIEGQVVNPSDVHMEAVGFADSDGDDHKSTDWEIWTAGASPELVWQTLGIEGVERLHTHLGDGVFVNRLAGDIELEGNMEYELRVRFRDDVGSVSDWSSRGFVTGAASTVFPMELEDIAASPEPAWTTTTGDAIDLPVGEPILSPADPILAIDLDGLSSSPGGETPDNAIDRTLQKYLNFGEENSGFIVTPAVGVSTITAFQITTANDAEERDPAHWALFGTNDPITSPNDSSGQLENWTSIDSGSVSLPSLRNTPGPVVAVGGSVAYTSYRMVFTSVKNAAAANSMQIAEIQFFGNQEAGTPPSLTIENADASQTLLRIEGSVAPGNNLTDFAELDNHTPIRVVIRAGSNALALDRTDLALTGGDGRMRSIFLPAVNLDAGEQIDLWVDTAGGTYFGTPAQTEPDFSLFARPADLTIPFIATRPGFVIEEVASDLRLPVNIAFVPDPGPDSDDPLYFVTELYGSIQVVTRDGTKHEFATSLLDYNPEGPISGSGEQGLTGIAVERDPTDPDRYNLYVGMLWDNGAPAGGAAHYPKVEKITSVAGGLSMDTRSVLLNMQPEVQGQSHQISNISIGPDGKLYVHNGDGFNASTALSLNQYRGKVLRMNLDGSAPTDNPFYTGGGGPRDYIYAYGLRNPFGGAWRASDGKHYAVENGPSIDRMAQINRGVSYGWDGSNASMLVNAIYNWNPAHAPVNITFVQQETFNGSQFPAEMLDRAYVSESGPTYAAGPQAQGKRITDFVLSPTGDLVSGPESLVEYVGSGRSSVVGLAAGPDGLYFSELYEDTGEHGPTASGSRIFRVRYVNPLAGDYDIDGDVDRDDYTVWSSTFGSNLLLAADGNGDGVVNAADYTVWRDNLGSTLPAAADSSPVPLAVLDAMQSSPSLQRDRTLVDSAEMQAEAEIVLPGFLVSVSSPIPTQVSTGEFVTQPLMSSIDLLNWFPLLHRPPASDFDLAILDEAFADERSEEDTEDGSLHDEMSETFCWPNWLEVPGRC